MSRATTLAKILNAAAANGIGSAQQVEDFRHLVLALDTAGSAQLVVKIQGSIQEDMPTFSAAQSPTNQWDYIEIKDLEDGTAIDGDTGLTLAGSDDHRMFEVNTNGLRWINAIVSSYTAGSITLQLKPFRM